MNPKIAVLVGLLLCLPLVILLWLAVLGIEPAWMVGAGQPSVVGSLVVLGAIVVDQYPCWIGVPNCD